MKYITKKPLSISPYVWDSTFIDNYCQQTKLNIILILCVIVAISILIYRIWSKDTVDYREILNLPKLKEEEKDLKVDELLAEREAEQEAAQEEMEEYDEENDN
jgi:hypothetical protein